MVEMAAETCSTFVILTDSHYFQFVREMDKHIIVKSMLDTKGTLCIKI